MVLILLLSTERFAPEYSQPSGGDQATEVIIIIVRNMNEKIVSGEFGAGKQTINNKNL